MTKKELAAHLGISGSMVTRLSKRGMPTDSIERAKRWRKRHLEPGRVKGTRLDESYVEPSASTTDRQSSIGSLAILASAADAALQEGDAAASLLRSVRVELRALKSGSAPRLTLRVWNALTAYFQHEDSQIGRLADQARALSADEFGQIASGIPDWGAVWLDAARDRDGIAETGWPQCFDGAEQAQ